MTYQSSRRIKRNVDPDLVMCEMLSRNRSNGVVNNYCSAESILTNRSRVSKVEAL